MMLLAECQEFKTRNLNLHSFPVIQILNHNDGGQQNHRDQGENGRNGKKDMRFSFRRCRPLLFLQRSLLLCIILFRRSFRRSCFRGGLCRSGRCFRSIFLDAQRGCNGSSWNSRSTKLHGACRWSGNSAELDPGCRCRNLLTGSGSRAIQFYSGGSRRRSAAELDPGCRCRNLGRGRSAAELDPGCRC